MSRDDLNRRRLRGLYDRNRRRVMTLADARDRGRGGGGGGGPDAGDYAPRRYIVSERRTRTEGFGRGGVQVRQVIRRVTRLPPPERFGGRGLFRRGNRDRFRRDGDDDRALLRDRGWHEPRGGDRGRGQGRGARLGQAARSRRRLWQRQRPPRQTRGSGGGYNQRNRDDRRGGQGKGRPARERVPTREQLDAQLDRFRAN